MYVRPVWINDIVQATTKVIGTDDKSAWAAARSAFERRLAAGKMASAASAVATPATVSPSQNAYRVGAGKTG